MSAQDQPPPIPIRLERYEQGQSRPAQKKVWLQPASGLLILAVDWLFFAEEAVTLGFAIPIACFLAFVTTTAGVYWIQRKKGGDTVSAAAAKALFGGFIAAIPTSIGGTILGTFVLLLAGMRGGSQPPAPPRQGSANG
jgi:hypothetical protein